MKGDLRYFSKQKNTKLVLTILGDTDLVGNNNLYIIGNAYRFPLAFGKDPDYCFKHDAFMGVCLCVYMHIDHTNQYRNAGVN